MRPADVLEQIHLEPRGDCVSSAVPDVLARSKLLGLRHTHATLFIKEGIPAKAISERLGHATTMFTIETYQRSMQANTTHRFAGLINPSTDKSR